MFVLKVLHTHFVISDSFFSTSLIELGCHNCIREPFSGKLNAPLSIHCLLFFLNKEETICGPNWTDKES